MKIQWHHAGVDEAGNRFEIGEVPLFSKGLRTYRYYGRRNNGEPLELSPYGNRIPDDWKVGQFVKQPGYHVADIPRGQFGEPSKIMEEALEFYDAIQQGVSVMALVELSDLMGAVQGFLAKHHPGTTLDDLCMMAAVTTRAFNNGRRTPGQ